MPGAWRTPVVLSEATETSSIWSRLPKFTSASPFSSMAVAGSGEPEGTAALGKCESWGGSASARGAAMPSMTRKAAAVATP